MGSLEDRTALTAKLKMLALTLAIVTCSSISFAETAVAADTCSAFIYPGTDDVDVKIAAIFGMHASNESSCSDQPQVNAIQIGLAMQWAVSLLNGENSTGSFLPGVKIGVDIYDDCNQDFLAARHAGSIAGQFSHRQAVQCSLSQQSNQQMVIPTAGIIGTTRSQTTTMVTRVARSTNLPVVGLAATLAELSDKSKYPGFVRTTPSDHVQAQAMLELALEFQWSYIVGIFTNDNYGQMGMERLQTLATEHRICVSTVTSLDILGQLDEKALESFVRDTLFSKVKLSNGTLGVVYFGQDEGLIRLLKLAETWSLKWLEGISNLKKIHWMVSDAVDLNTDLIDLVRQYKTRVVGVDMVTAHLPSFQAFEQEVLWSPPAWAREGRWRGALETLARERYGCASYNTSKAPASAAGCSVSGSNIYSGYLAAAVDSVYLLANTLKTMHSELCHGQSGVCDSFMASLEDGLLTSRNLTEFDYTDLSSPHVPPEFAATGRALVPNGGDFLVRNQSCYDIQANMGDTFVTVGSYSLDGVDLLPQFDPIMPQSGCSNVCQECHDLGSKSYEFLDGDYILLGIFSVHWKAGDMTFKCGAFRKDSDSFPAMKAFVHAVGRLIQETGVKFGYLALDDCYSPLLITRMLSKILSGDLEVTCKSTHAVLDPKKIVVAVGAQSSPATIAVLPMLQNLRIPLISYSSTNPSLDNRIQYPYFSRTVISDTQQASAISLILQQLNVTYVGAVVFGNLYGRALYQRFREKAEAQGICVADAFEVTDKTTVDDLKPLLKEYREGAVGVVVAFVMDGVALNLVKAVQHEDTFVFLGSEAWGRNTQVLEGDGGERVRGSLILEPTGFDVDYGFKKFVQTWGPQDAASDSWLRKYWENFFNCNLPRGFSNIHQTHCLTSPPYFSSKSLNQLDESPLVVHTIVATTTAGKAVQDHLSELPSSQEVVLPLDPAELSDKIRQVTLTSANGSKFKPFLASGNGNAGIKVYNVQQMEPGSYSYVEVGTFRSEILTMDQSKVKFYDLTGRIVENVDSSCKYKRECNTVCRSSQAPGVPASVKPGPGTGPEEDSDDKPELIVIILAVVVCVLLLIIIVIIVLAVLTCTGRLAWSRKEPSDNSWPMETYWQGSCASGFKPTYCQSGGSQSSSSFTASGGDLRPPLPQRKRKDTLSSERTAEPGGPAAGSSGSACKTASDVVVVKPGEDGLHSDSEVGQARCQSPRSGAAGLMDPRLAVDRPERMTPSPHRFWSSDLAASLVSSPSAPSSSGQSDNSCIVQNQSSSGAALADVEIQLNASKLHPLSEPAIASLIQQQQQQQQSQKLSQYPKYQQPHQQFSQTPQQQPYHENLQYQQQQAILHALQRPNLDERLRQLYISHLNQTQQPIEQAHQTNDPYQNGPNRQKGHIQQKGKPEAILEHPDKFVLFSNLSDARAIYTIPQSSQSVVTSSTDPDYIYVLTAEGMLSPVPYENYARLQEAGVVGNHQNIRSDAQGEENTNLTIKDQREAVFHGGEPAPMTGVVRAAPSPVQDVGHQPMVTPNGLAVHNPRDLVCAQILKQQPGQVPGYLYKPPRGHGVDQEDKASGKQASDDDRHPPPAPHSHQAGSDYLTVFSASGLVHTLSNQDSDMPALVMLPEEVFHTPENEPIAPQTQIPGRGEFQSSNSNRAPLDFPGSVRDPAGKPAQGVATTYTVASTDYPVKTNQTRMSPMPQKAHRHPHVTANLPDVEKHFGPEKWRHAHGNKGASSTFDQQPREPYQNRHEPSPNGVIPLDPSGLGFTSDPLPDVASNQPGQIYSDQAKDPNNPERSVYPQGTRITTDQYTSQNPPPVSQVISAVPGNQASHETGQNNKKQHSSETIASNSKNNKKNIGSTAGFDLGPANETSKVHQDISPALLDGDGVTAETRQTVVEAVDTSDNRMSSGSADFTSSADTDKINNGTRADGVGSEKKQVIRGGPGLPQQPDILENLAESEL